MKTSLQWGGRFGGAPDAALLAFGSSLEDDFVLAPFDVRVSRAHVAALFAGNVIDGANAAILDGALQRVEGEIQDGSFTAFARAEPFEDIHGAIDARVRELEPEAGASLHAGRSRNDQVATTLALYAADRAVRGARIAGSIIRHIKELAERELAEETILAATTHTQPAQPILFAFWLAAIAEPFVRAARRFANVAHDARRFSPLGSGAVAGSTLPLHRGAASAMLGFTSPSRNAMDSIGTRDTALDVAHAFVRAAADASRVSAEVIVWATPAFGYVHLGDGSSTGSSLMPQKRNPDTFELVRGGASELLGLYTGAVASTIGIGPSYHRDLQHTKRMTIEICERGTMLLDAFLRALVDTSFDREAMARDASNGYTVATDMADELVRNGVPARDAHARIGELVSQAERERRPLEGAPTAHASVAMKATSGSTSPQAVRVALDALARELAEIEREVSSTAPN